MLVIKPSILITIFSILLILYSCKSETNKIEISEITVLYPENKKIVNLSSIVSDIRYLPLETKKDFLLGDIEYMKILDKIYCMQSNKINVFDLNGYALYEINHYGKKGPEGYINLAIFQVDTTIHILEIWDRLQRKIIRYDSNTGIYMNSKRFNVNAMEFIRDHKGNYIFYVGNQPSPAYLDKEECYQVLKFNENGDFIQKYLVETNKRKYVIFRSLNILYNYQNNIFVNIPAGNYIYKINESNMDTTYFLNFGKKAINEEFLNSKESWTIVELQNSEFAWNPGMFYETDSWLIYKYLFQRKIHCGFINKISGEHFLVDYFKNDFDAGFLIFPMFIAEKHIIASINSFQMKKYYEEIKKQKSIKDWELFKRRHEKFVSMCENLTDTDNQVIVLMTLK